jgi:hypothetical protein
MNPLANAALEPQPVAPTNTPVEAELPAPLPDVISGATPAVLIPPVNQQTLTEPVVNAVIKNYGRLPELGLEAYELPDLSTVVFNPSLISEDQIKEAEANGTLAQIAIPAVGPGPEAADTASAPPAPVQQAPLAQATLTGPPPVNQSRLTTARVQNFAPRQVSPVEPKPVLNALGKRAI